MTGMTRTASMYSADDPLGQMLRPPVTETPAERQVRLLNEAHARQRSNDIDEMIKREKDEIKKKGKDHVKLLLLGQSESGKSTLLKQFQLLFNPNALEAERSSWRTVVFWNLARTIKSILDTLDAHDDASPIASSSSSSSSRPSKHESAAVRSPTSPRLGTASARTPAQQEIATLRLRLSPVVACEATLARRLTDSPASSPTPRFSTPVYVRSGWQSRAVTGLARRARAASVGTRPSAEEPDPSAPTQSQDEELENVGRILVASSDEMARLWEHPVVKDHLHRRSLGLNESSEFFMGHVRRIAQPGYMPTVDDILHARIQTMGVAEHNFQVPSPTGSMTPFSIYDVAGASGQRHAWVPFFDSATAIIFMAPISAFDQFLEEVEGVNRMHDSLQTFGKLVAHPVLANVNLVLFLNKADILKKKLAAGVKVNKYITSFGDRPNDFETVVNYFKSHFHQIYTRNKVHHGKKQSQQPRTCYEHVTSVVDTRDTRGIIENVRDAIFRSYLSHAALV